MQKDPVCGMMVDEKKTKLTSKHEDKTFYFCSASCKTTFDKTPIDTDTSSPKGWRDQYRTKRAPLVSGDFLGDR